jgi:hypothetical protein
MLVISQLGNAFGASSNGRGVEATNRQEAFMRMLSYYEIRSQTERPSGAPTKMNAAQPTAAAHRRNP